MAASPSVELDGEIEMAGNDDERKPDGERADEGRLLDDVGEDAELEIVRDRHREDDEHDGED